MKSAFGFVGSVSITPLSHGKLVSTDSPSVNSSSFSWHKSSVLFSDVVFHWGMYQRNLPCIFSPQIRTVETEFAVNMILRPSSPHQVMPARSAFFHPVSAAVVEVVIEITLSVYEKRDIYICSGNKSSGLKYVDDICCWMKFQVSSKYSWVPSTTA